MQTNIITTFSPPGNLNDFTNEDQKNKWSEKISNWMDNGIRGYPELYDNDGPRNQFFNPLKTEKASDFAQKKISWIGFPKQVKLKFSHDDEKRWKYADASRDVQDEYCEWSVERNKENKITKVFFTCEGPEYWNFLGKTSPHTVIELYRKFINPLVEENDLFENGIYQPRNKWNSDNTGAMHLIQINNTLTAEIELAAGSSVVRKIDNEILTDQQQLIECGTYGQPSRNSDPFIGSEVNSLTREKAEVSLLDPVGLYFDTFKTVGWKTPKGEGDQTTTQFWKILRGTEEYPVRVVYEVPENQNYVVGDITINGQKIKYGAQIADFVKIKLMGIAQNFGKSKVVGPDLI